MSDDGSEETSSVEPVPNTALSKVRKVTGELGELGTMGGGGPGSKPTDFRWAMDRDLEQLLELRIGPWEQDTERPAAVSAMKDLIWKLKRRANRSGYLLLSEVCVLFVNYL